VARARSPGARPRPIADSGDRWATVPDGDTGGTHGRAGEETGRRLGHDEHWQESEAEVSAVRPFLGGWDWVPTRRALGQLLVAVITFVACAVVAYSVLREFEGS